MHVAVSMLVLVCARVGDISSSAGRGFRIPAQQDLEPHAVPKPAMVARMQKLAAKAHVQHVDMFAGKLCLPAPWACFTGPVKQKLDNSARAIIVNK